MLGESMNDEHMNSIIDGHIDEQIIRSFDLEIHQAASLSLNAAALSLLASLKYKADDRFFGWLAYTLSRSVRKDADRPERLFALVGNEALAAAADFSDFVSSYKDAQLAVAAGDRAAAEAGIEATRIKGRALMASHPGMMPIDGLLDHYRASLQG